MIYRRPSAAALKRLCFAAAQAEAKARAGEWVDEYESELLVAIANVYPRLTPPPKKETD